MNLFKQRATTIALGIGVLVYAHVGVSHGEANGGSRERSGWQIGTPIITYYHGPGGAGGRWGPLTPGMAKKLVDGGFTAARGQRGQGPRRGARARSARPSGGRRPDASRIGSFENGYLSRRDLRGRSKAIVRGGASVVENPHPGAELGRKKLLAASQQIKYSWNRRRVR